MINYYCPYCNPKYQFTKQLKSGNLICGLCGEDLIKKPLIRINKLITFITITSLLLPLIYTFIFLLKNPINIPKKKYRPNSNPTITDHLFIQKKDIKK
tara:strand:+ start:215 stop:508 length:294 start_codon:yes stop_codon:yes gene_type:complete